MKTPSIGAVFEGRFEILDELGRGGFGVVLRARDQQTGAEVAIKYLQPHPGGYPARIAARFAQEAEAMASLRHPNIVRLVDAGQSDDGLLYIAMELVEGGDLTAARVTRTFQAPEVESMLLRLLDALGETHAKGILHRDIKPSNILLVGGRIEEPKLVDFGIAKLREPVDGRPGLTATGHVVGTPTYMAPELLVGEAAGPSTDVYSLGLVAIELLTDRAFGREWHRRATAQYVTKHAVEQELPTTAGPPQLRAALAKMTHGDPAQRAASAAHARRLLGEGTTREQPAVRRPREQPTSSRLPIIAALLVVTALSLLAITVLLFTREEPQAPTAQAPTRQGTNPLFAGDEVDGKTAAAPDPPVRSAAPERPSPGCGQPAKFVGVGEVRTGVLVQTWWRTIVPEGYDPNRAHPVMLVFHADLFSGAMMIEHLRLLDLANTEQVVIIAPDFDTYPKQARREQVANIPDALRAAGEQLCLDPKRIFVLGYGVGSDGAELTARLPWVTALFTGGYFPAEHDVPSSESARQIPHLYYATTESKVYPVEGGMSCAFLNTVPRVSLAEHEARLREENRCEGEPTKVYDADGEVCYEWTCESRFVSCHLAGGLFWPGSGIRKWPLKNVHGCRLDPTISDFPGTQFMWDFFASAPPSPEDVKPPW